MTEILINIGPNRSKQRFTVGDLRDLVATINKFDVPDDQELTELITSVELWVDSAAIGTIDCGEHKIPLGEPYPTDVIIYTHQCTTQSNDSANKV